MNDEHVDAFKNFRGGTRQTPKKKARIQLEDKRRAAMRHVYFVSGVRTDGAVLRLAQAARQYVRLERRLRQSPSISTSKDLDKMMQIYRDQAYVDLESALKPFVFDTPGNKEDPSQ